MIDALRKERLQIEEDYENKMKEMRKKNKMRLDQVHAKFELEKERI